MKSYSLALYDRLPAGGALIGNVTALLRPTWRRSIRRVGGCWLGTAQFGGTRDDLDDWFQEGLLRELRETYLGDETWRGAIVRMEYARGGDVFVRDATTIANAIRSIYTRIGDNLLTNGSGESGAWTAYNGATVEQDATWSTQGTYSIKITVANTAIRGATIQGVIAVVAAQQYVCRMTLKVTSGSWRISINRADNDQSLAFFSTRGASGDFAVDISIPATNLYTGNVDLRITSEASAGVINADAAVLQVGPQKAETGWYVDADSIALFGRREEIYLRSGMSHADANGECVTTLRDRAWPIATPPRTGQTIQTGEDSLTIIVSGYWAMLNWLYTTLAGTRTKSAWVTALAALQNTYVTRGAIETNSTDFFVEDRAPLRVGDLLRDLTESGEASGAKWSIGVGPGGRLNYNLVAEELAYVRRGGRLVSVTGDEIEAPLARPGWALWADLPAFYPAWLPNYAQHDLRWTYLEEIEMLADGSLSFNLD